jgi:hypothetical protein
VSPGDLKGIIINRYLSLLTGPALRGLDSLLVSSGDLKEFMIDSYHTLFETGIEGL